MSAFARFVVRPNTKGGMVGFNHNLFKEGVVYEVTEVLGEFVIREVGDSPLGLPDAMALDKFGFANGWTYDHLYTVCGGNLVRTASELSAPRREPRCFCPATSEYDPPCPSHGMRPIGMREDGTMTLGEYEP